MVPNRAEPSTLWLDGNYILRTLREGQNSKADRIFADSPPKIILWSYRMDAIEPVVAPLSCGNSYVQVAPNPQACRPPPQSGQVGRSFDVPIAGAYRLYSETGEPVQGRDRNWGGARCAGGE